MNKYYITLSLIFFFLPCINADILCASIKNSCDCTDKKFFKSPDWIKTDFVNKTENYKTILLSKTFQIYKNFLPIIKIHIHKENEIKTENKTEHFFLIILSSSSSSTDRDTLSNEIHPKKWNLFLTDNNKSIPINSLQKLDVDDSYNSIFSKNGLRFGELYRISFLLDHPIDRYCFNLKKNENEYFFTL